MLHSPEIGGWRNRGEEGMISRKASGHKDADKVLKS